jgi:hypothetical protein
MIFPCKEVSEVFGRILRISFLVGIVSLLLAGMAWAANWNVANIGGEDSEQGPYAGGDVEFISGGFIITATGGDIWSNKLGCTLAYIDGGLSGNFTIEYTIVEHTGEPPTTWTKCGVMVAQAVDPETPYVFLASMPSNDETALNDKGCKLVTRSEWAGDAGPGSNGFAPLQWPVTYKLVREGDLFTASLSFDGGATYQSVAAGDKVDNTTLALDDPVVVGIAINGHNAGATTGTATVVDIKVDGQNVISAVDSAGKLVKTWAALKAY